MLSSCQFTCLVECRVDLQLESSPLTCENALYPFCYTHYEKKVNTKGYNNEHYYEKVNFEKNEVKSLGKLHGILFFRQPTFLLFTHSSPFKENKNIFLHKMSVK